jgi:Regulator of Ty1 transposition protein 107 BRCT domain/twin BRCT domain
MTDVVACCADLPEGDADAIAGGIIAMGGLFTSKLTSQVTHIVALSMDSEQVDTAIKKRLRVKVVLPHWFDDCLRLGRKIEESPYELPDPEILRTAHPRAPVGNSRGAVSGALDPDPSASPPPTPSDTRKEQRIFKNKKILLGKDLGIGSHLRGVLEGILKFSGGKIVDAVESCDIYIGRYRQGLNYKLASRAKKHVGNLAWLYYLITTDMWTSPLRRLLHYPIAKDGLPGFKGLKISLSNYTGDARTYLENLILATGAECTKTLKQDNTHLITAHIESEKCAAAKDWGIHLVNHLWLEESYAKWKLQSVSNSRYTHFPSRTNLGEIVGQTRIDRSLLEPIFFPQEDVEMADPSDDEASVPAKDQETVPKPAPKAKAPSKNNIAPVEHRTPATTRFIGIGKENITPSTSSSRKAKDAATAKLHDLTPDIALYEKERKRVGGVVFGGRRKNDEDRVEMTRKRSAEDLMETDDTEETEPKKPRKGLPPPAMHLLISSYKKWIDQPKVEDSDRAKLRSLGIIVTTEPSRATHLAAPHIVRTLKFVAAIAYAPAIVSTTFIDACLEKDDLVDPDKFLLQDKANEKKLGFSLSLARERAKENRNRLLGGRAVYCLENIHGGYEAYKSIVEANGGICMIWRNRKGTMVPSRRAESDPDTDDDTQDVYLLSGPGIENDNLWKRFRQMAEGSRKTPRIVKADWLLESAMCQKVLPTHAYEIRKEA